MPAEIDPQQGAGLFGGDALAYDAGRPGYPAAVYRLLQRVAGLAPGCRTLEVAAGSGHATRPLWALGARPLVAVEPDPGFAPLLRAMQRLSGGVIEPHTAVWEDLELPRADFDLVVVATALHWLEPERGVARLGRSLRPGGWLAAFWNVFGDPERPDPFHEATRELLDGLDVSPSRGLHGHWPYALDEDARREDFRRAGALGDFRCERLRWTLSLTPEGVRSLYATFSPVLRLPAPTRRRLLDALAGVARERFDGRVERHMVTPVYLGRREEPG